jgi:hypothetical protein
MSFEHCRQTAMECRERTSRENGIRFWYGLPTTGSNSPSRADTITPSGENIKLIAPGFNPVAAA